MRPSSGPGIVFVVLGAAFVAVGISGQRTFLFIGIVFLAIGLATFVRRRRGLP